MIILIIDKAHVEHIRESLISTGITGEIIDDVKKMLEIKEALLWRADAGSCCGTLLQGMSLSLENEVTTLKNILSALEARDTGRAAHLLSVYADMIDPAQHDFEPGTCQPHG